MNNVVHLFCKGMTFRASKSFEYVWPVQPCVCPLSAGRDYYLFLTISYPQKHGNKKLLSSRFSSGPWFSIVLIFNSRFYLK